MRAVHGLKQTGISQDQESGRQQVLRKTLATAYGRPRWNRQGMPSLYDSDVLPRGAKVLQIAFHPQEIDIGS